MHSAGALDKNTQVCREGEETWRAISKIDWLPLAQDRPTRITGPSPVNYVCPRCGSDNIQSVPLLYQAGTSTSTSTGRVIGIAGLGTDQLTPVGGATTTRHRQQTLLAARYSPPTSQIASNNTTVLLFIAVFALMAFGVGLFASATADEDTHHPFLATFSIIGGIATIVPAFKALKTMRSEQRELARQYQSQFVEWTHSFLCHKCGYCGPLG
jgi:predicted RNA-binding Zn-ribbon protein involved in translation (DUF1610 family)